MRARLLFAAGVFGVAATALADGGRLRAYEETGDFRVAIFTRPEPLAAGPADVSVLVQDRETGEALLDADVTLVLSGPDGRASELPARRHARNRLFYGAAAELSPGAWTVTARIRTAAAAGEARAAFEVGEAPRAVGAWPYLALPPLAVALFAANRTLRSRERKIALASQLDPRARASATGMFGSGQTHVGILSDDAALAELSRVLDGACGEEAK
jgi:hypothetical protein